MGLTKVHCTVLQIKLLGLDELISCDMSEELNPQKASSLSPLLIGILLPPCATVIVGVFFLGGGPILGQFH